MNHQKPDIKDRHTRLILVTLIVLAGVFFVSVASAQSYKKGNRKFYKAHYKKQNSKYARACDLLEKKRYQKRGRSMLASNRRAKPRPMAEVDHTSPVISSSSTTEVKREITPLKKLPITPKIEEVSEERLVELHKKEDEVLAMNNLPVPTSQKHEEVRKRVGDKLASKTNVYPLSLDPLYFSFDQDEFSVVDMEPFLVAAEYALQGRTVLIEGHTDSRGADDYNVKLSIKRVQKIRQLMLDMGVPDDRISVVGYGEEIGKPNNTTSEGRQRNRRVDFTIF